MKERLRLALSRRRKLVVVSPGRVPSAVLVPIFEEDGEFHVLMTKRTNGVKDHKGEICFPGGSYEEPDGSLLNTALRETTEEVGLPAELVEPIGELDDCPTFTSVYLISPFVGFIPWPYTLKIAERECEEIIAPPLSALLDEKRVTHEVDMLDGQAVTRYTFDYNGKIIWGATARILKQFLDIYTEAMRGHPGT